MELATLSSEEPVTQIAGDVPVEPLPVQADATNLEMDLQAYERPLAVTPFGTPEIVPDWQVSHAMSAYIPPPCLGHWIRTDLGVRTFQGLGKNGPKREQVVRRITRDAHTHQILEFLSCDPHFQVPLHRRCLPGCGPTTCSTRDIQTTFVYRLLPLLMPPSAPPRGLSPSPFPSGGGCSLSFSPSFSSPSFLSLLRGPQFSTFGASENSTFGTQTLMSMRKFLEDAEKCNHQGTKEETSEGDAECKEEHPAKNSASSAEQRLTGEATGEARQDMCRENSQIVVEKDVIRAFRALFDAFEGQFYCYEQQETSSNASESDEPQSESVVQSC